MQHKIILFLISVCPIFTFSQTYISADSANKLIMNGGDCSDRTFTRVQTLPSLSISKQSFIDSISIYLKLHGALFEDGITRLSFVVSCHSKIINFENMSGDGSGDRALKSAIFKFSDFWIPARQNNYIVNSYVRLNVEFKDNLLDNITITQ